MRETLSGRNLIPTSTFGAKPGREAQDDFASIYPRVDATGSAAILRRA